jgi:MscS family membrane protein
MRELLRSLLKDLREPLMSEGPMGLTLWQWAAGPVWVLLGLVLGYLLARATRWVLGRIARSTPAVWDDRLATKLSGPLTLAWSIGVLTVTHHGLEFSKKAEATFHDWQRGGLYLALFWAAGRAIGVSGSIASTSRWSMTHPMSRALVPLASRIARIALFAFGVIVLLTELGVSVTSLLAGLGLGGLAVALAAQKTVENLIGAISIGADQPFIEGDFVKIEDFVATVERVGLRSTRFRTLDRTLITIPNGKLAEMKIESFTARDRFRLATKLQLVYETNPEQLRAVLANVEKLLREHPKIWPQSITVRLVGINPPSLDIELMAWFAVPDWDSFQLVRQEVLIEILQVVQSAGSSLAFPTQTLRVIEGQHPLAATAAQPEKPHEKPEQGEDSG